MNAGVLAYLLADPELSLQSILMVSAVISRRRAFAYVGLVALFSIVAGLLSGTSADAHTVHVAQGISLAE